jgi:hypothetical protein
MGGQITGICFMGDEWEDKNMGICLGGDQKECIKLPISKGY